MWSAQPLKKCAGRRVARSATALKAESGNLESTRSAFLVFWLLEDRTKNGKM